MSADPRLLDRLDKIELACFEMRSVIKTNSPGEEAEQVRHVVDLVFGSLEETLTKADIEKFTDPDQVVLKNEHGKFRISVTKIA